MGKIRYLVWVQLWFGPFWIMRKDSVSRLYFFFHQVCHILRPYLEVGLVYIQWTTGLCLICGLVFKSGGVHIWNYICNRFVILLHLYMGQSTPTPNLMKLILIYRIKSPIMILSSINCMLLLLLFLKKNRQMLISNQHIILLRELKLS